LRSAKSIAEVTRGVAVRFEAPAAGLYRLDGLFAPNNATWSFGNSVDVLIARGLDLNNPLFAATISDVPDKIVARKSPRSKPQCQIRSLVR
jgi:hypothetical protein